MSRRHESALNAQLNQNDLKILARELVNAIKETEREGIHPAADPAVLLLITQLSFATNTERMDLGLFRGLIKLCEKGQGVVVHEATINA